MQLIYVPSVSAEVRTGLVLQLVFVCLKALDRWMEKWKEWITRFASHWIDSGV